MTESYDDLGSHARPTAWDDALDDKCPTCGAEAKQRCILPGTDRPRHCPCVARLPKRVLQ